MGAGTRQCCGLGLIRSPAGHCMGRAKRTKVTTFVAIPGILKQSAHSAYQAPSCHGGPLPKVTVTAAVSTRLSPVLEGTSPCSWPMFLQPSPRAMAGLASLHFWYRGQPVPGSWRPLSPWGRLASLRAASGKVLFSLYHCGTPSLVQVPRAQGSSLVSAQVEHTDRQIRTQCSRSVHSGSDHVLFSVVTHLCSFHCPFVITSCHSPPYPIHHSSALQGC